MKNKREILSLAMGTLCLVTLIGCNNKSDEEASAGELIIEPLVGIGPVKFGMSKEEVIKHFGPPDKVFADGTKLNYVSSRGLSFTIDSELGLQEIGCWSEGMLPSRVTTFIGKILESRLQCCKRSTQIFLTGISTRVCYKGMNTTISE